MSTQLLFRISVFALVVSVQSITFASDDETDLDTANVVAQKGIRDRHFAGFPRKYSPPKAHITLVKGGDMLRVTLNNGDRFSGRYSFYTHDSIGIVDAKYTYEKGRQEFRSQSRPDIGYGRYGFKVLAKDEIKQLSKGKKHTLYGLAFGALIGLGIGGYIFEAEDEAARERFKREQDYYDDWWRRRFSGIGGSIYDANLQLRYYPTPPQFKGASPWLIFGPAIGGAVLGAVIGGKIYTYKRISIESTRFSLECIRF